MALRGPQKWLRKPQGAGRKTQSQREKITIETVAPSVILTRRYTLHPSGDVLKGRTERAYVRKEWWSNENGTRMYMVLIPQEHIGTAKGTAKGISELE